MTRITDRKIPCVYIHVYQIVKNRGPGPYNLLRHADNRKYFSGLSLTRNRREAHMFYLAKEVGKIWRCSCWGKGNFIMINEFKLVKPEKLDHLHLVYYFTVPLKTHVRLWKVITVNLRLSAAAFIETSRFLMQLLIDRGAYLKAYWGPSQTSKMEFFAEIANT